MFLQRTIRKKVKVDGIGLHTGAPASLVFRPAPAGSGIHIVRSDLPGQPSIAVQAEHVRATQQGQQAGIVSTEAPIHRSNVMVIDPETKQPTRVGITVKEEARDGKVKTVRVRVAKKSGKELA